MSRTARIPYWRDSPADLRSGTAGEARGVTVRDLRVQPASQRENLPQGWRICKAGRRARPVLPFAGGLLKNASSAAADRAALKFPRASPKKLPCRRADSW